VRNRFFFADPHFSHRGMVQFVRNDGTPLRPWGRVITKDTPMSPEECDERVAAMDEALVENWNSVVGPYDKVELLGDVVINRKALPILDRLNGKKRLRLGNHDIFLKDYGKYFDEVSAYKVMDDLVCSHIPLHEDSVKQRWKANVHGHLHDSRVMYRRDTHESRRIPIPGSNPPRLGRAFTVYEDAINPRYLSVSAEQVNYTPISLDEVYARIAAQQVED
jgi:calcineurin-like phosphoesterase family protein